MRGRRNHDAGLKAHVALDAVKGARTVSELAADIFERGGRKPLGGDECTVRALHAKVGD